ncbi:unnamed protein product [Allacma fusca]|uniref:Progestin and adipoQ receptor family member 4 n=1 Tax=Allacma fusca TaxID=39272 RepID=A0A8J2JY53_9HEXA|nr:unnamed protein product [Allacma fusca]
MRHAMEEASQVVAAAAVTNFGIGQDGSHSQDRAGLRSLVRNNSSVNSSLDSDHFSDILTDTPCCENESKCRGESQAGPEDFLMPTGEGNNNDDRDKTLRIRKATTVDSGGESDIRKRRDSKDQSKSDDGANGIEQGGKAVVPEDRVEELFPFFGCHGHCLLGLQDMPTHLQFNRHVHSGYRPLHDFKGCCGSLFYIHNETVNIITHVIPIVWVLLYWRSMYPWEEIQGNSFLNVLGWSHVIASISPWLGSVIYHLFMNHRGGAKLYNLLLRFDMFGIWVTECFGALTNLSASTWCLPGNFQSVIIIMYAIGSVWGLQKALTAWTPMGRRMCFAPVFVTRLLGFFLRISKYGGGEPDVLLYVILQDVVSLIGGMIGVIRVPEKWFPGKLDLFCNSHHIMHVLVVLAVFYMNLATNGDIRWIIKNYSQGQCAAT